MQLDSLREKSCARARTSFRRDSNKAIKTQEAKKKRKEKENRENKEKLRKRSKKKKSMLWEHFSSIQLKIYMKRQ